MTDAGAPSEPSRTRVGAPAVVIVTYESAGVIDSCLRHVLASDVTPEVVVVDNGSRDDSAALASAHPGVEVIRNDRNRGFAAAVRQGVAASTGDPIVLLNPDTDVAPDCLRRLSDALARERVGIAGCKVADADGHTIQHAGGVVHANALTDHIGRGEIDRGQYDEVRDVSYVTGAGLAIHRRVWELLGGVDSGYWPAYYEEIELCWRARAAGYRVIVEPRAGLRHREAASSRAAESMRGDGEADQEPASNGGGEGSEGGQPPPMPASFYRAYHRNRMRFVLRNFSLSRVLFGFVPAEADWLWQGHHRGHTGALLRAYGAAVLMLPSALAYRIRRRLGFPSTRDHGSIH